MTTLTVQPGEPSEGDLRLPKPLAPGVAEQLGTYVYALRDPRDKSVFYVGKGTGDRIYQHVWSAIGAAPAPRDDDPDPVTSAKIARIREIHSAGLEVEHWVIRHQITPAGNDADAAFAVEQGLIDVLRLREPDLPHPVLTNIAGGHTKTEYRAATIEELAYNYSAEPLETDHPLLLITLGDWVEEQVDTPGGTRRTGAGFKRSWLDPKSLASEIDTLGDSVRCWWSLNPGHVSSENITHVVPVYRGVTRGLFEIVPDSWAEVMGRSGKPVRGFKVTPVLSGDLFDDVVGRRTPKKKHGDQSRVNYWPRR